MKRFYKAASVEPTEAGFAVALDGRRVRTPGRQDLTFPTRRLAMASAAEWNAQEDKLDIAAMPMTALSYAAVDRVAADPAHFVAEAARHAETDLLCYRAPSPASLRARQDAMWQPILDWGKSRYGADLVVVEGVMPVEQPEPALIAVGKAFGALDPFRLTVAHAATGLLGSALLALALIDGECDAEDASEASEVDDRHQLEEWGADEEAEALLERRRAELQELARFLDLLSASAEPAPAPTPPAP